MFAAQSFLQTFPELNNTSSCHITNSNPPHNKNLIHFLRTNKRQRQNAGKREAQKAVEADWLATLAKMLEPFAGGGGGKGGVGMKASVDWNGKLVWD
ncbi:hypothetical protein PILCRDRAFT_814286 [Piloderma croceum F 1598]|uniref:Uncharacterized protein n=1 Tax=Piloderma croceum (strain F 1598) TaxID=765440 RepID=A0A0C3GCL6_PILCF|nr:hypothetical protein PILCRDRAFT_814286 [Piloderma croceum F 1598]